MIHSGIGPREVVSTGTEDDAMISNDAETSRDRNTRQGIYTGSFTGRLTGKAVDRQARIDFLMASARYLDVNISRHELVDRLVRN